MTGGIILAAGPSSRMGQSKQLMNIDGQPLLLRTVRAVADADIHHKVVVLGANEEEHRKVLKHTDVEIVYNADWKRGMGTSIRAGLQALLSTQPAVSEVIIFVCDQPLLTSGIIRQLLATFAGTKKPIVAAHYRQTPGVPVLFDHRYFHKLLALPDDEGAKKLVLQSASDAELVPFPGGELDLDTMQDYQLFLAGR